MANPIHISFDGLAVVVNGQPTDVNILGALKTEDKRTWVVVTNVPELAIGKDEYEIFLLITGEKRASLHSIADTELYNELVEMWEETKLGDE